MALKLTLIIFGTISVFFFIRSVAEAHHQTYLPLAGETPLMRAIESNPDVAWCVNPRAAAYPNFVAQLIDVNDQYEARTGIGHHQVVYGSAACQEQHVMPDTVGCVGCAARVFYWYQSVLVEYKWQLGFTDWRSAQGHEIGHARLGLHEQYIDQGSIRCTGRQDTVMDCGSGVRYPQARDVLMANIFYGDWYDPEAPDPRGPQDVTGPRGGTIHWDACIGSNRFTPDIKQVLPDGSLSNGVVRPGGSLTDWTNYLGWTRVPKC
jgi:hypothetical protein